MTLKKSREFSINGESISFDNFGGKLIGINKKNTNGLFEPVDNSSTEFNTFKNSEESLDAFRKSVYGSDKESYPDSIEEASFEEQSQYFAEGQKKFNNEQFLDKSNQSGVSPTTFAATNNFDRAKERKQKEILKYPFDIDTNQDHLEIIRYKYVRPNLNMSKSAGRENIGGGALSGANIGSKRNQKKVVTETGRQLETGDNVGDSVLGEMQSILLLPMPKVTDVNGVEWGKSELNSAGLTALNVTNFLTGNGRLSGKDQDDRENDALIRQAIASRREIGSAREGAAALYTGTIAKLAGTLTGSDLDADTFLARQGGKVLNPNAEMLFQGPVIRDFGFSFIMIARSEKEGAEIRKIIKELKIGMAPKFRSTTFLENPDVFSLQYKSGDKILKTVNRFSPGGLALTTMRVDYSPNGYWSAYRDSQPVAVKMDLDFTELRPIYLGDQQATPEDSVGL